MRLIFMGTPAVAVPTLRRCLEDRHDVVAVWTQPDRPSGRGNRLTAPPVKEFALGRGLAVYQPTKIKTEETGALFASHAADAAVVVAYGRILPASLLYAPPLGCVNVHFSLLPKYRGAAPVNWAIVRGESETGVTTMRMDEGLDTGAILMQRRTMIEATETAPQLMERLAVIGAELLSETLVNSYRLEPQPQRNEDANFAPLLERVDGKIDWSQPATVIERAVRGFQPWPNAYTFYRGTRLVIWQASVDDSNDPPNVSGEISKAEGDTVIVACGQSTRLRLVEVQPEGKRRMSARDWLNGVHPRVGEQMG